MVIFGGEVQWSIVREQSRVLDQCGFYFTFAAYHFLNRQFHLFLNLTCFIWGLNMAFTDVAANHQHIAVAVYILNGLIFVGCSIFLNDI
jgi:hypothetical protein